MRKKKQLIKLAKHVLIAIVLFAVVAVNVLNNVTPINAISKLADGDTSTLYSESLGNNASTEYAGRIWSDKSVYKDPKSFLMYGNKNSSTDDIKLEDDEFLVAFSTLGTSQTITGQSQVALDVVFVVDMSNSMNQNRMSDDDTRLKNMVEALNEAVESVLEISDNARIAVRAFNGSSTQLLGLDHYTKLTGIEGNRDVTYDFFTLNNTTIRTRAVSSSGTKIDKNTASNSGTNIQNGIAHGLDILKDASTTVQVDNKTIQRVPVLILLSDGEPTSSSEIRNWWDASSDNKYEDYESTPHADNAMKVLMTAGYMKKEINKHYAADGYANDLTIYTIGVGLEDKSGDAQTLARIAVNPKYYLGEGASHNGDIPTAIYNGIQSYLRGENPKVHNYTFNHPTTTADKEFDITSMKDVIYVDEYVDVTDQGSITDTFKGIVDKIILSTAEAPTEIKAGTLANESGYITYTDPIGKYMEVKDVVKILYAGEEFTRKTATPISNGTSYEFTGTVSSGVYGDQNLGDVIIEVTKDASGNETLTVKVPASLIPVRVNSVTLDTDGNVSTHTNNGAFPIRVLYTVGIQDGDDGVVDSDGNVKVSMLDKSYVQANTNADGTINFYTNLFDNTSPVVEGHTSGNATVEFEASHKNPFYYMQDQIILLDMDGNPVKGSSKEALLDTVNYKYYETYYNGNQVVNKEVVRTGAQLKRTDIIIDKDGNVCRAAGSPRVNRILEFEGTKGENEPSMNNTQTAENFYSPTFDAQGSQNPFDGKYVIYLGNNGVFSANATGTLKVSKDVVIPAGLTPSVDEFAFRVNLNGDQQVSGTFDAKHFDSAGEVLHTGTITDGATIRLKDGEYVEIYHLAPGTTYEVTETAVAGFTTTVDSSSGTIAAGQVSEVNYVNTYAVSPTSDHIEGTKTLASTSGRTFMDGDLYRFRLIPSLSTNPMPSSDVVMIEPTSGTTATFVFGDIEFTKPGQYKYEVYEIEPGVTDTEDTDYSRVPGVTYSRAVYSVTYNVVDNGSGGLTFTKVIDQLTNDSGDTLNPTVRVDEINVTNIYNAELVKLNLVANKYYTDTTGVKPLESGMFEYKLEAVTQGAPMPSSTTVTNVNDTIIFPEITYDQTIFDHFTSPVTFTYQLTEVINNVPGVIYETDPVLVDVTVSHSTGEAKVIVDSVIYKNVGNNKNNAGVFVNTYDPTDTTAIISVNKVVEGRGKALAKDEFTFTINAVTEGAPLPNKTTVGNNADGTVNFGEISYSKVDTYVYEITENAGNVPGITYDTNKMTVTVEVTDNNDGTLKSEVTYSVANKTFTNTYDATDTVPFSYRGFKTLTNRAIVDGEFFYEINAIGNAPLHVNEKLRPNSNLDDDGVYDDIILLEDIVFTQEGNYQYTFKEQIPSGATLGEDGKYHLRGITYDPSIYRLTINVKDIDESGNAYVGELRVVGTTLEKDPTGTGNNYETLTANDNVTFANQYDTEPKKYQPSLLTKLIEGDKQLKADDFEFVVELVNENGNVITDESVTLPTKATNNAAGEIAFGEFTFTKAGTYFVRAREVIPATATLVDGKYVLNGITYSDNELLVKFEVKDMNDGTFAITMSHISGSYAFTNEYNSSGTSDVIPVTKNFTGRDNNAWDENDEFEFVLEILDPTTKQAQEAGQVVLPTTTKIKATADNKTPSFDAITFKKAGTYKFNVREVKGDIPNVNYDVSNRTVTFVVSDDGMGNLNVVGMQEDKTLQENPIVFNNVYDPDSTVLSGHDYLGVNKTLSGREWNSDDNYQFTLTYGNDFTKEALLDDDIKFYTNDNTVVSTDKLSATLSVNSNNHTSVHFGNIEFAKTGDFVFKISEVIPSGATEENGYTLNGVQYDTAVHTFTISVVNDAQIGGFVITKINDNNYEGFNPQPAPFVNTYTVKEVPVDVKFNKEIVGREWLNEDEYSFTLRGASDDTIAALASDNIIFNNDVEDTEMNVTINKNTANHEGIFKNIIFKKAGTYHFNITEDDTDVHGIAKDNHTLTAIVSVVDNAKGQLVVEPTAITYVGDQTFTNTFTPDPIELRLVGTKTLIGRPLNAGEFSFNIVAHEKDTPLPGQTTVTNGRSSVNNIEFGPIRFTEVGTYEYTISEILGNLPSVEYDATPVRATVVVAQGGDGQLKATISYRKGEDGNRLEFINKYEAIDSDPISIDAKKVVTPLEGNIHRMVGGEFTFVVTPSGENNPMTDVTKVQNDMYGNVDILENIVFTNAGTYTYTVTEAIDEDNSIYIYDSSVYTIKVEVVDNTSTGKLDSTVTITKDGQAVNGIEFNNQYSPEKTSIVMNGHKELITDHERELQEGEFTFELTPISGLVNDLEIEVGEIPMPEVDTATNTVDGLFQFGTITYETAGVYTYEISETNTGVTGVTYDKTVYEAVVKVEDINHELVATVTYSIKDGNESIVEIEFENTYEPIPTTQALLSGQKTLEGRDILETDGFTFVLKDSEGEVVEEVVANTDGYFEFEELVFDRAGTYTYTISEEQGSANGVEYDIETLYTVVIEVVDNEGQLESTATYYLDGQKYKGETIDFVNTYTSEPTSVTIGLSKVLEGKIIADQEFDFEIKAITKEAPLPEETIVSNDANGKVSFGMIEYTEAGTYEYEISEVNGEVAGIDYDATVYTFVVEVVDNLEGNLIATTAISVDEEPVESIIFTNTYNAPILDVTKVQVIGGVEYDTEDGIVKVEEGQLVKYVIRTTAQEGKATATNIIVTDAIPEGLELVSIDNDGTEEDGIITWNIDQLEAGQVYEVSFTVKVPEVEKNTQWENIATMKYNNGKDPENKDPNETKKSNKVEIKVELEPELTPVKTQQVNDGKETTEKEIIQSNVVNKVKYTITVTAKEGTNDATDVVITDKLPKGATLVEGSITNNGVIENGVITWNIGTLKAGKSITVSFEVEVAKDITVKEINNKADVTWNDDKEESNEVEIDVETPPSTSTGDDNNIALYAGILGVAAVGLGVVVIKKKKEDQE